MSSRPKILLPRRQSEKRLVQQEVGESGHGGGARSRCRVHLR